MGCSPFLAAVAGLLAFDIVGLPILFKYTKFLRRKLVFTDFWNIPIKIDFEKPTKSGIKGAKNFYIDFLSKVDDCYVKLGVWYICPQTQLFSDNLDFSKASVKERILVDLKIDTRPIVLYCHGNANHRGAAIRIQIYKLFQQMNFHVIAFDYRGYGDSTKIQPTEQGVVEDTLQVYSWIQDMLKSVSDCLKPPVILWGHSLGTAIVANLVSNIHDICHNMLDKKKCLPRPDAIVLEAPFNNLVDAMKNHPYTKIVNWLPYFKSAFVKPIATSSEFCFVTDENLQKAPQIPILMLHSVKDPFVPYCLAAKLHQVIKEARNKSGGAPLVFHTFEKKDKIDHNNMCQAPELKNVINEFLGLIQERKKEVKRVQSSKMKRYNANTVERLQQSDPTETSDLNIQNDDAALDDTLKRMRKQREKEGKRLLQSTDKPCYMPRTSDKEYEQLLELKNPSKHKKKALKKTSSSRPPTTVSRLKDVITDKADDRQPWKYAVPDDRPHKESCRESSQRVTSPK